MLASAVQAIIPKARGMYAKHLGLAEYEELLRKRTVAEVAANLKRQPYFKESLATLSTIDPHRGQIEELLSMDIFNKYASLLRYDFADDDFTDYYLLECEAREVLKALQLLSTGLPGTYLRQIPSYLVEKSRVDLFALGRAQSFGQVLEVVRGTSFYRPLKARYLADPYVRDFPATEAAMLRAYYGTVLDSIDKGIPGRDGRSTRELFLQEIEVYNLDLLLRVKTYFPHVYTNEEIFGLMIPYYWRIGKRRFEEMATAPDAPGLLAMYKNIRSLNFTGTPTPEQLSTVGERRNYHHARTILHLTSSPYAALAAFVSLAKLERDNVVNILEGVRYGMNPEEIRPMLRS